MGEKSLSTLGRVISVVFRMVVGLGILIAGIAIAGALVATRPVPPKAVRPDPNLQVRTMVATLADVARTWEGYGTARAMEAAQIPAQVSGTVIERPSAIEPGATVRPAQAEAEFSGESPVRAADLLEALVARAGDRVVVRIDPSDYVSRLDSALDQADATRAQLDSLDVQEARLKEQVGLAGQEREIQQRELDRAIDAQSQGGSNTSEIERRRALLLAAKRSEATLLEQFEQVGPRRVELRARLRDQMSAVEVARQNLARTVIVSPIAGQLQEVMVRPGEWLQAGMAVARVVDLSRIEVPLRVPAEASGAITVGDAAELRVDTRAGSVWKGRVVRLAPEVDSQTRTFAVFVEVDQDPSGQDLLRPGQFVVGRITTRATERVLLLPRRIIVDDRVYVASMVEGAEGASYEVARAVPVTPLFNLVGSRPDLDPVEDQWSAVRAGEALSAGERLIVSNLDDLHDGLLVTGREAAPGAAEASASPANSAGAGSPGGGVP